MLGQSEEHKAVLCGAWRGWAGEAGGAGAAGAHGLGEMAGGLLGQRQDLRPLPPQQEAFGVSIKA